MYCAVIVLMPNVDIPGQGLRVCHYALTQLPDINPLCRKTIDVFSRQRSP